MWIYNASAKHFSDRCGGISPVTRSARPVLPSAALVSASSYHPQTVSIDAAPTPFTPIVRASALERIAWSLMGLASWALIATSLWLRPDVRGFGTHQQLGLPPCGFRAMTGIPCPGCGLTTSFAWMARGHVFNAFSAHLMGPPLFAMVCAMAIYAPFAVSRARPLRVLFDARPALPALLFTAGAGILTFALRLLHVLPSN
jgi:hypothetical protein